jgi:hypothetical protein
VGRPKTRQLEDADSDPRQVKVMTWRQTTNGGYEWACTVKEAKVLGMP